MMISYPVGLIWITPSDEDFSARRLSSDYHLGCAYLSAYLRQHGYASKQYLFDSVSSDDFTQTIIADGIRVLGFSVKDTNYYAVRWAASAVKARDPSIVIVTGGLTATFSGDLLFETCPAIDACLRGYSELTFHTLVESIMSDQDWRGTPGLSFHQDGKIIHNPEQKRGLGHTLDDFPSPYLTGVLPGEVGLKVGISTSRGCIFHCTFCNPTAMAGHTIAFHSDDRVIEELIFIDSALEREGIRGKGMMFLAEDYFAINLKRTKRLCERIAESRPKHIIFGCETRIERLNEEVLRSMYAAGFRFLKFGLESGNPRVLNLIKKVRTTNGAEDNYIAEREFLNRIAEVVRIAKSIGFWVVAGVIFGLPGERLVDAIDTLDFLRRINVDEYYHNFLQLFPGTEAFQTYKHWGYRLEIREDLYPTIYRTYWHYPVQLVPRLTEKLDRPFQRSVVQL